MALYQLEDFVAHYGNTEFDHHDDIKNFDVYSDIDDDKVGTVKHILVDDSGRFRYLVVDTGFWFFGRQVLLPIGRSRIDYNTRRVYAQGLTKEQVKNLPDFHDLEQIDADYEERVRGVYSPPIRQETLETSTPLDAPPVSNELIRSDRQARVAPEHNTYRYEHEPSLYDTNEQDHQNLKLYEERLVATKSRVKTGEVSIGKHIATDTARVSIPIEKERIVIEHTTPEQTTTTVLSADSDFSEGEIARMGIYEETPHIHKETVVREEVKIQKIVEQDTVEVEDTIRREELDINRNDPRLSERRS